MLGGELGFASEFHTCGLGSGDAVRGTLPDQLTLELGQRSQHVQHQSSGRRRGIDGLIEHDEIDLFGGETIDNCCEIQHRSRQTVELGDDEHVAVADEIEGAEQFCSVDGGSTGLLLLEDFLYSGLFELAELDVKRLAGRRDACVSDVHRFEG